MRRVGGGEVRRHVLVDGNNLLHKAYYVFVEARMKEGKPLLSTRDGFHTGVVHGFLEMLSSWLREMAPFTDVSVFFDGQPSRRKAVDPTYKSGRDESAPRGVRMSDPSAVSRTLPDGHVAGSEVDVIAHVLPMLGCAVYHHPHEEADDLIASFCGSDPESVRVIVSSDKDFFQLLEDPRVVCYVPGSGSNRFFDGERSAQYWKDLKSVGHRIEPGQVRMFKVLCGDHSDSIVGVPKLRKRVAVPLCHLSTVEEVLATGLPGFSPAEKEKTLEVQGRLRTNLELVTLRRDIDLAGCLKSPPAPDRAMAERVLRGCLEMSAVDLEPFAGATVVPFVRTAPRDTDQVPIPVDPMFDDI